MNPLDTLTYTVNPDSSISKVIVQQRTVKDINLEISAVTQQITAFQASLADSPQEQNILNSAIANYQQQLVVLQTAQATQVSAQQDINQVTP